MSMKKGKQYRFKNQEEILVYLGRNWSGNGYWEQFRKVGEDKVWCELQFADLEMMEEVV